MKKLNILKSILLLSFLVIATNVLAQSTKKRADEALGERAPHIALGIKGNYSIRADMNAGNAIDANEGNFAIIRGNAGVALGLGGFDERLRLTHNNVLPANTRYYTKVGLDGGNDLFGALLGGSLGGTLSDLLKLVLFGKTNADFRLLNNNTTILQGNIYNSNFVNNPDMIVGVSGNNDYYIIMNPKSSYNIFELELSVPGLVGLGNKAQVNIYDAFYYNNITRCDIPLMTSYTGSEGLLTVLQSAPVTNAHQAIDNDLTTYSTIGVTSLLGVQTNNTIEQLFHLPAEVNDKSVRITMQLPTSLLKLDIAKQSSVVFYKNGVEIATTNIDKNVIGLDVLGLINSKDAAFSFSASPKDKDGKIMAFDKVGIRVNIPIGLDLLGGSDIRVYDVAVINDVPVVKKVCTKEFITTVSGVDIRETKFNITDIIPNYNPNNTYTISDVNGKSINPHTSPWQPLGSYVVKGITGSTVYCPTDNVSIKAIQDNRYRINGKIAISLPLDADDNGTADAQHTFKVEDYSVIDLDTKNADVTNQYKKIQIFAEDNPTVDLMGTTINYSKIGSYNYYVKTTNLADSNCDIVRRVTVYVYDKAVCEYRYEQLMADKETASTVTLLGIPLGGTSESAHAVDTDLSTHGSIFNVVSLLGIGTTSQNLLFTENGKNKPIDAGTPLTVKLGQDYSLLQVIGAVTIRPINTSGDAVGPFLSIGESDLANVLVGDNVFEFTFIPKDENGKEIVYSGVQVNLGSVLGLGNTTKVFSAFIDDRKAVADATCNPNKTINGAEIPGKLDATLLLNTTTKDVLWGTQDIGLGVGTLLSSTLYPYQAADAINNAGSSLHGTPDLDTYALFNTSVDALNQMSLTVKFKETARPGDKVRFVLGNDDFSILDATVLGGALSVQRYMGTVAIGEPVVVDAGAFINLDLLSLINPQGADKRAYVLDGIGAPFDRVEIRMSNVLNVGVLAPKLRVYDVSLLPYFAFDSNDEITTLCTSVPFEIEKMDPCTSYKISYAYPTIVNGKITAWNDITNTDVIITNENEDRTQYRLQMKNSLKAYNDAGTLYMKVVTTRQGCLYGDAQYLKVKIASCANISNPMIRTRL